MPCASCCPQQHADEEQPKEHDELMHDAKPQRQLGSEGWRAALAAWQQQATALLASHNAKARHQAI